MEFTVSWDNGHAQANVEIKMSIRAAGISRALHRGRVRAELKLKG